MNAMKVYIQQSAKKNAEFNEAWSALIETGVDPTIARNVLRWRWALRTPKIHKRVNSYNLTPEQMTSPSLRLAIKIEKGTRPGDPMPHTPESVKWQHVILAKSGVMYDRKTQGEFALDTYL